MLIYNSTISSGHGIVPRLDSSDGGTSGSSDYYLGMNDHSWWYSASPWTGVWLVVLGHVRGLATWQYANGTPNEPLQRPALLKNISYPSEYLDAE